MSKNFTNNWFETTGKANFEKYVLPLKDKHCNFLEVGCYEGQTSCWLMENTNANLDVIDTFAGGQDLPDEINLLNRFKANTDAYHERIWINIGKSQEVMRGDMKSYDFIYIDGSHLAGDTLEDAVLAFRLLKKGGIMIFDDYTWGRNLPLAEIPAVGIDAFVYVFANQLEVLEKNAQMVIRKL